MKIVTRTPVASFIVLSYLISWVLWLPLVFIDRDAGIIHTVLWLLGGFGPFVAAVIISRLIGVFEGFKGLLLKWRVSIKWYLAALALPVLVAVVAYIVFLIAGGSPELSPETPPLYFYPFALLFVMFLGGGLEEPGWRGFALPVLLKRYTPFVASLIVGIVWAFWHLPLFLIPTSSQFGLPFGWYSLNALALSVIFTWLFLKSKGSTVMAIILHGGVNAVFSWYPGLSTIPIAFGTLHYYAPITVASWLVAGLMLIVDRERFFGAANALALLRDAS